MNNLTWNVLKLARKLVFDDGCLYVLSCSPVWVYNICMYVYNDGHDSTQLLIWFTPAPQPPAHTQLPRPPLNVRMVPQTGWEWMCFHCLASIFFNVFIINRNCFKKILPTRAVVMFYLNLNLSFFSRCSEN